jgi:hypothetical protein
MPLQFSTDPGPFWRVGFQPTPWDWTDWRYAPNGRFSGRWDDLYGNVCTVYAGATLFVCLVEVLAKFRRDVALTAMLAEIDDHDRYPHRRSEGCHRRGIRAPGCAKHGRLRRCEPPGGVRYRVGASDDAGIRSGAGLVFLYSMASFIAPGMEDQ